MGHYELAATGVGGRVSVLDASGKLLDELSVPGPEITGIQVGSDCVYITESSNNCVYRIRI